MRTTSILIIMLLLAFCSCGTQKTLLAHFVAEGYVIYEKVNGDLNNDGLEDLVLIVKSTKKENVVKNRFDNTVDRNRRGIVILFKKGNGYQLALENKDCFYSENEDGGNYYAPQLSVAIEDGNLTINYKHGRYGYWQYVFKYQNSDFELIAYDAESNYGNGSPNNMTTIDFLTKTKVVSEVIEEETEDSRAVFKDSTSTIKIEQLVKLSEIKDFEELDMSPF